MEGSNGMGWLKAWRERQEVRRAFARYLNPELAERLAATSDAPLLAHLEPASIQFVLVQVRDDRPDQVAPRLATAHAIVVEKEGTICDLMSSMSLSVFGFPVSAGTDRDGANRDAAATELLRALAPDARLVHGVAEGLIGNSGSPHRFHYGPVIPHFTNVVEVLIKLEFGEAREFSI
jgi:hypothetical protein